MSNLLPNIFAKLQAWFQNEMTKGLGPTSPRTQMPTSTRIQRTQGRTSDRLKALAVAFNNKKDNVQDYSNIRSERYVLDGDAGMDAEEYKKVFGEDPSLGALENINQSGRTGMYTKRQLRAQNLDEMDYDVSTTEVQSTAVDRIQYNPKTKDLNVSFVNGDGTLYTYPNVPQDVVDKFVNAQSKGEFLHRVIAPLYSVGVKKKDTTRFNRG